MSDKIKKTEDVVFFVIDSDDERRNFYMSICQMVRGVRVFGFDTGADAVSFAHNQRPDAAVIAYGLNGDISGIEAVHKTISLNEHASIAVIADVYTNKLEDEILAAGALDCLSMSGRNDSQLYAMKNLADMARTRRADEYTPSSNPFTAKTTLEFINIKSYSSANSANRCAAAAALSAPNTNKLLYIRVFSFLYDFLIKCFLNEVDIVIGIVTDSKRIIICTQLNERSATIMKESVFYFVAEKFIEIDDSLMTLMLQLDDCVQNEYSNITYELVNSLGAPTQQRIDTLKQNLKTLASISEIFHKFSVNIAPYAEEMDIAVNETLDKIDALFSEINNDPNSLAELENKLFAYLAELCIIIKTRC